MRRPHRAVLTSDFRKVGSGHTISERPVAWGTTGLPWESAWVWDIEALGCVGRGFDEAAWGAAGGLSEFQLHGTVGTGAWSVSNEGTLTNRLSGCHLQNRISCFFMCF